MRHRSASGGSWYLFRWWFLGRTKSPTMNRLFAERLGHYRCLVPKSTSSGLTPLDVSDPVGCLSAVGCLGLVGCLDPVGCLYPGDSYHQQTAEVATCPLDEL